MAPTIRVDDEVYKFLKERAEPFEDSPNDVLKRVLGLNGTETRSHMTERQTSNSRQLMYAYCTCEHVEDKHDATLNCKVPTCRCAGYELGTYSAAYDATPVGIPLVSIPGPEPELVTTIDEPMMLIRINKSYSPNMSEDELYDATRRAWRVGPRREGARFACAVFQGVVLEVYEIDEWHLTSPHPGDHWGYGERWEFEGTRANGSMRKYVGQRVKFERGAANPITYVNC